MAVLCNEIGPDIRLPGIMLKQERTDSMFYCRTESVIQIYSSSLALDIATLLHNCIVIKNKE